MKNYRSLEYGEIILVTDEWFRYYAQIWTCFNNTEPNVVGQQYKKHGHAEIRRPIESMQEKIMRAF